MLKNVKVATAMVGGCSSASPFATNNLDKIPCTLQIILRRAYQKAI